MGQIKIAFKIGFNKSAEEGVEDEVKDQLENMLPLDYLKASIPESVKNAVDPVVDVAKNADEYIDGNIGSMDYQFSGDGSLDGLEEASLETSMPLGGGTLETNFKENLENDNTSANASWSMKF